MRCFIAIDIPDEIKKELIIIQKQIPKDIAELKEVRKENLHLTIKFLGEISEAQASKVKEALKKTEFRKFRAELNNIGFFPSSNYIRIVWVGLEPSEQIRKMHDKIDSLLSEIGIKKDTRFETHLTLARVRDVKDKREFAKSIKAIKVKPLAFEVSCFALKKSTLTKQGAVYEDLMSFDLS